MAQLMPLPLAVSCFSKIQTGFTFLDWYRRTWVVPDKGPLNGCVCVCGAERHGKQESGKHLRNREEISRSGMDGAYGMRRSDEYNVVLEESNVELP